MAKKTFSWEGDCYTNLTDKEIAERVHNFSKCVDVLGGPAPFPKSKEDLEYAIEFMHTEAELDTVYIYKVSGSVTTSQLDAKFTGYAIADPHEDPLLQSRPPTDEDIIEDNVGMLGYALTAEGDGDFAVEATKKLNREVHISITGTFVRKDTIDDYE